MGKYRWRCARGRPVDLGRAALEHTDGQARSEAGPPAAVQTRGDRTVHELQGPAGSVYRAAKLYVVGTAAGARRPAAGPTPATTDRPVFDMLVAYNLRGMWGYMRRKGAIPWMI